MSGFLRSFYMTAIVSVLYACVAGGCSTYLGGYTFQPGVAEENVVLERTKPAAAARSLVSIRGVRRATDEHPASVEVRFLIENATAKSARIAPSSLRMVTGDLVRLESAQILEGSTDAPPDGDARFTTLFPFPDETTATNHDLNGLNLSWRLEVGDETYPQSVTFNRVRQRRSYPTYGTYHPYFRYGFHHHH